MRGLVNLKVVFLLALGSLIMCQEQSNQGISEDELFQKFEKFMGKYDKVYDTIQEFTRRFEVFKSNYILSTLIKLKKITKYGTIISMFSK